MASLSSNSGIKVRVVTVDPSGPLIPKSARLLLSHYWKIQQDGGFQPPVKVTLDGLLPKSLNHQYGGGISRRFLKPEILQMRQQMALLLDGWKRNWRPSGVMGAVIVIYSPLWLTKEYKVRDMDIDNKIKPVLDAYVSASGVSDKAVWGASAFKAVSNRTATKLWLFDLGDVVERFEA